MFPAIKQAWREFRQNAEGGPISLGLKSVSFSTTSLDETFLRKHPQIREALGGGAPAWSGESVSEATSLNHSVVWACTRVISEVAGMLPLPLMQRRNGGRYPVPEHSLYSVLHDEPNEQMSAMEFRETMTARCVLRGNAYARIVRRPGTGEVIALYPTAARPDRSKSGSLVYLVKDGNEQEKTITVEAGKAHEILHLRGLGFDGLSGVSVVGMARQSIGNALAAERHAGKFWANGGRLPYTLSLEKNFKTDQEFEQFRADWEDIYRQPHKAPMLLPGMKYERIGLNATDSQFLETRQWGVPELCRWFLMRPHIIGDLSRATDNNIEHQSIEFVTMTMMAWFVRWEQGIYRCLLTPDEKGQGFYAKHNVNALLRGDFKSRMEGYSIALQNGKNNIDEVRALEDENPLPNGAGAAHHFQLNMQTLPGTGEPTAAERSAMAKAAKKQG